MPVLISYFERMTLGFAWVAAWLFALSGAMLSYEVVARYFFLSPTKWAAELSQLCLIYGTLLSMSWLLQHRRHIQINAVTTRLPDGVHRVTALVTMVILIIFCAYVTSYGWTIFEDSLNVVARPVAFSTCRPGSPNCRCRSSSPCWAFRL